MFKKLLTRLNRDPIRESDDIIQRDFFIGKQIKATLFFIGGLCHQDTVEEDIIKPLILLEKEKINNIKVNHLLDILKNEVISVTSIETHDSFDQAILPFMSGESLLLIDGIDKLTLLKTSHREQRGIEEPQSEIVIRGPRDGFIESLQTNIILIRQHIKDPNLTIQIGNLGRRSKKGFALAYIKGITNQDLVEEARYRISCVDTDDVSESGALEQLIEDNVLSPFPQILQTERPDKAVGALLNGQIVILLDGTPFVLLAPVTFQQLLKSPEDYYDRWQIGTFLRFLRYTAAFFSLFLPALYIAMVSYHQGMIPTQLAISIAASREGVPFPAIVEAMLMELTIELLREAGIRLPRAVGQTIGIVGGLVIGEAAVRAGIVSPILVIIVALTVIASFAIPAYNVSITFRLLRFGMMIAASIFGLFGILIVYILINIHLVGLRSFGAYYTSPFAPYHLTDWLDLLLRAPASLLRKRPSEPRTLDNQRQQN